MTITLATVQTIGFFLLVSYPHTPFCTAMVFNLASVLRSYLVLSGHVETNLGAMSSTESKQFEEVLAILQQIDANSSKLPTGQVAMKSSIKRILIKQLQLQGYLALFGAGVGGLKNRVTSLFLVTNNIGALRGTTFNLSQATTSLLIRIDGLENISR